MSDAAGQGEAVPQQMCLITQHIYKQETSFHELHQAISKGKRQNYINGAGQQDVWPFQSKYISLTPLTFYEKSQNKTKVKDSFLSFFIFQPRD